jgi:hypothetical protein
MVPKTFKLTFYLTVNLIYPHTFSFFLLKCLYQAKRAVIYLYVMGIDFAPFFDFSIWFWNCSDSTLLLVFILSIPRDRPFNLKGGYGFLFRSEIFFFGQHES